MSKTILAFFLLVSNSMSALIASYSFSGNAADVSGNGFDGSVFGATLTADRFGNSNSAYSFDGIDDYIDLPNLGLSGSVSISGWFSITGDYHPNHMALLGQATSYSERWVLSGSHSEITWYDRRGNDNNPYAIQKTLELERWYHLVAVISDNGTDPLKVKMYLDGEYQGLVSTRGLEGIQTDYQIGKFYNEFGWDFSDGKMDDINIFNHELSDNEISGLYHAQAIPEPSTFATILSGILLIGLVSYRNNKKIRSVGTQTVLGAKKRSFSQLPLWG